jgi:hypothetical protein
MAVMRGIKMNDLLGGAQRIKTRARGFVPWSPRPETLILLDQVKGVLEEYEAYLPLTCRQIFYRLVGAHNYEKTENAYARLCEMLNRARRAEMIDMGAIRDDGGQKIEPFMWSSVEELVGNLRLQVRDFRLDRQEGHRLVVMCEAAGMAPQLASAVDDYGITVISSGGFESVTEKHRFAEEMSRHDAVEVLHIGDHDPSGAHIFLALQEDVEAFGDAYGLSISFTRLAVTPEQVSEFDLPTAPPKATDRRAFGGDTCQAEAIPPDTLREILLNAVIKRVDDDAREQLLEREAEARAKLERMFKKK